MARLALQTATLLLTIPIAHSFAMTWATTWADILSGGPGRWKVDDLGCKKQALAHIEQHSSTEGPMRILCPLAGDDPFVHYAWSQGHDVTAIDIVPAAVKVMRGQFGDDAADWSAESKKSETVWTHKSGRATLIEGDMLTKRPELSIPLMPSTTRTASGRWNWI